MSTLTPRASGLERVMLCPGSLQAEAPMPFEPGNQHTERGKRLHDGMALAFRIGLNPAMAKLEPLWEEGHRNGALGFHTAVMDDLEQIAQAHAAALTILPDGAAFAVETPLDLGFMGLASAKPDLIARANGQLTVIDWKFGKGSVTDPGSNAQLKAYGAGAYAIDRAAGAEPSAVNLAIIQPGTWKVDEALREATLNGDQLRDAAKAIKLAVKAAQQPGAPRTPSPEACRYCKARAVCSQAIAAKGQAEVVKQDARKAELAVVTEGTPIEVKMEPALPSVVVVVSAELTGKANGLLELAQGIKVTDAGTAQAAGGLSKEVRNLMKLVDDQRVAVKAPFLEACRLIDAAPKPALAILKAADDHLKGQMDAYVAEQEKLRRDAEAKLAAKQRELDEARRKEQEALAKAERARTDAGRAKAEEEAAKQREAALVAEMQQALAPAAPEPVKVAGFATKEEVTLTIPDLGAVPPEWARQVLIPDERVLKALFKSGKLTEAQKWLKVERKVVAARR